jgi:uncharacterized protein YjbI with pentapeptide repeats
MTGPNQETNLTVPSQENEEAVKKDSILSRINWGFEGFTVLKFLELIIVPLTLSIAGLLLSNAAEERQERLEEIRFQQNAIKDYLNEVTRLLGGDLTEESKNIIKARTTTVLTEIGGAENIQPQIVGKSKGLILQFLYESQLLSGATIIPISPGEDFNSLELKDASLYGLYLNGVSFQGATLNGSNFQNASFNLSNFQSATLRDTIFFSANLIGADLSNTDLRNADFRFSDLRYANLRKAKLNGANLQGANLAGADLSEADLINVNLENAILTESKLINVNFVNANMKAVRMDAAQIHGVTIENSNLNHAIFVRANIQKTSFYDVSAGASNFQYAYLDKVTFQNTDLENTMFRYSNIANSKFIANSRKGSLHKAIFQEASIKNSLFRNIYIGNANFCSGKCNEVDTPNEPYLSLSRLSLASSSEKIVFEDVDLRYIEFEKFRKDDSETLIIDDDLIMCRVSLPTIISNQGKERSGCWYWVPWPKVRNLFF